MSDWQVGDLAIAVPYVDGCPNCDGEETAADSLPVGTVREVVEVHLHPWFSGIVGLAFVPQEDPWCACSWRRLDRHECCEEEFVTLLKCSRKQLTVCRGDPMLKSRRAA